MVKLNAPFKEAPSCSKKPLLRLVRLKLPKR
jgi:hypothetical protein